MSRIREILVILTCIILVAISTAMYVSQVAEHALTLDARTRLQVAEDTIGALRLTVDALASGQRSNGEADARVFAEVGAIKAALARHTADERYRFGVTVDALGAGR